MKLQIKTLIEQIGGKVGIYAEKLSNGTRYLYNEKVVFSSASVIKAPILYLLYEAFLSGNYSPQDSINYTEKDLVDDSPFFEDLLTKKGTCNLYEVAHSMIVVSDNTSTNLLIDLLGFEAINNKIQALGMKNTFLKRKMCDFESRKKGLENLTTPEDMAIFLKNTLDKTKLITKEELLKIKPKELNSKNVFLNTIKVMSEQKDLEKIPSGFTNENLIIANKPGELPEIRNDVALIITETDNFVISIFCDKVVDELECDILIGKLSKCLVENL